MTASERPLPVSFLLLPSIAALILISAAHGAQLTKTVTDAGDEPESLEEARDIRFALTFSDAFGSRSMEEYDDRFSADADGTAGIRQTFLEFAADGLFIPAVSATLRIGQFSADMDSFGDDYYNENYHGGLALGASLRQKLARNPDYLIDWNLLFDFNHVSEEGGIMDGRINEWQLALQAVRAWDPWTVEAGLGYSDMTIDYRHPSDDGRREGGYEATGHWGLFTGVAYRFYERFTASSRIRFPDLTSFTLGISYEL